MKTICGFATLACVTLLGVAAAVAEAPKEVKVPLTGTGGQPVGTATFKTEKDGVKMSVHLINLPEGFHAVHIHEHPVCDAPDFKTAGGHFNPTGKEHGFENPQGHHAGDTPQNIEVFQDREGDASFLMKDISLDPAAPNSIFANGGTSVVVHEGKDDMKTDPSGNSGNRVGCGVVKM